MSPEQITGNELTGHSDLYSLGSTIYHCLTGQLPFDGQTFAAIFQQYLSEDVPDLRSKKADTPIEIEKIVMKLLAKEPDQRYQAAGEVKADLLSALNT